jgi:spore coat protein H
VIQRFHPFALVSGVMLGSTVLGMSPHVSIGGPENQSPRDLPGAGFFTEGVIPELRIELAPDAMKRLRAAPRTFVAARILEGATLHPQVGVHLKGSVGSFRPLDDKPSLTLDFCRFTPGGKFHGLRRIYLNNSVEDPSYASERLASELFLAAGVPAPRVTRARVELNGRALGLYVLKEGFTEDFLSVHFNRVGGELYEPGTGHDVDEHLKRNSVMAPFEKEGTALRRLAAAAADSNPASAWPNLDASLDTERFLAFMAMEVMLGHRDGYCLARNNFRVYHDVDADKMVFLPHGMDQLFGTAELPWQPRWVGRVARAVMATPEGQQRYAATFGTLFTNVFKVDAITRRVDELTLELRPVSSRGEWVAVCEASGVLKEHIAQRKRSLVAQLNRPVRQFMVFANGVGRPDGWEIAEPSPQGRMGRAMVEGRPALHIATSATAVASWRAKALVAPGRYRFEGRARIAGVQPLPHGTHQGAGLRIAGAVRQQRAFIGDADWQTLATEFEVSPPGGEVEFICELRARAGEVWFDLASLRVLQVDDL